MLRKDLEDQIAAKLLSLSNEDAQRISEEFVRIRFPDRFPYFSFRAYSPEGKSRSGWPDAAYVDSVGKIEGVEATHTASRAGVIEHLNGYLEKSKELGADRLRGFVHVSVSPRAAFTPQEIEVWTNRFIEAGFKAEKIQLIFGQGLVEILTRPEFARTRMEVLGINDLPSQFSLYRTKIGPDQRRLGTSLVPSWEDYEGGRIHRPKLADTVATELSDKRIALVRGVGASGKSVMAWLLAQDTLETGLPAFLCDFATIAEFRSEILNLVTEDLKRFANPRVLFVVDNIHLDEVSAKEIYLAWDEIPIIQRPKLLLLGRETRTAKGSPIESLHLDALPLRARRAELRGVFRRLALRQSTDELVPDPPEAVLNDWLSTFGGQPKNPETTADLIAFSSAVIRRIGDLLQANWILTHQDAIEEVKEAYLRKLSAQERKNLMRLCVAQEFELSVPIDALDDQDAELAASSTELGIVFRDEFGKKGQYTRYRLAHAALGELLLAAQTGTVDRLNLLREMAVANPVFGVLAAVRLERIDRFDDANTLTALLLSDPETLLKFDDVHQFYLLFRVTDASQMSTLADLDALLTSKNVYLRRLTEIVLNTPLHYLAAFLRRTKISLPQTFTNLEMALSDTENQPALMDSVFSTSIGDLADFLKYSKTSLPRTFAILEASLSDPKNHPALVDALLNSSLERITHFLKYAQQALPKTFTTLEMALSDAGNLPSLVNALLNTPLDHNLRFLRFAKTKLKCTFLKLEDHFSNNAMIEIISERMLDATIKEIASALKATVFEEIFSEAFKLIELPDWEQHRKNSAAPEIDAFVAFQQVAFNSEKTELTYCIALNILENSTRTEWDKTGLGLHHLTHVIRLASAASIEQKLDFVHRAVTSNWLDMRYETVSQGALAGNLFALSRYLPPASFEQFDRETLRRRIVDSLRSANDTNARAIAISFLGSAKLMAIECDARSIVWPKTGELEDVLLARAPAPDQESLRPMDQQLWCGLYTMAASLRAPLHIPAHLGEGALELWIASVRQHEEDGEPDGRFLTINSAIISWLESCQSNEWKLVPPQKELF